MKVVTKSRQLMLALCVAALAGRGALAESTFSATSYFSSNCGQDYLQRWNSSLETGASDQIYQFGAGGRDHNSYGLAVSPDRRYVFQFRGEPSMSSNLRLYRFDADGNRKVFTYGEGNMGYVPNVPQAGLRMIFTPNNTMLAVGGTTLNEISQNGMLIRSFSVKYNSTPIDFDAAFYANDGFLYGIDHWTGLFKINPNTNQVVTCVQGNMITNRCDAVYIPAHNTFALTGWTDSGAIYDLNGIRKTSASIDSSTGLFIDLGYDPTTDRVMRLTWSSNRRAFGQWDANPASSTYGQRVANNTMDTLGRTPNYRPGEKYQNIGQGSVDIVNSVSASQFGYLATTSQMIPAPVFHQRGTDAPWQSANLLGNTHGYTMNSSGCFVTATTMALDAFGHTTDPGKLNTLLTQQYNGQYTDGAIRWWKIPQQKTYGQTDGVEGPAVRFLGGNFSTTATKQDVIDGIAQRIRDNGPVILTMPQYGDGLLHYNDARDLRIHAVLAWKVVDNVVYIRNPLSQGTSDESVLTLDSYINWVNGSVSNAQNKLDTNYNFLRGKGYTYSEAVTAASKKVVMGGVNSLVDFVITDPLGRRLGYDPTTNTFYNEIPDSAYFRIASGADGAQGGEAPVSFQIGDYLAGGNYQVQLFGLADGAYNLELGSNSSAGFNMIETFSGTAFVGSQEVLSFTVPEPATLGLLSLAGMGLLGRRRR